MTTEKQNKALLKHYNKYSLYETPFGIAEPYFENTFANTLSELKHVCYDIEVLDAQRDWLRELNLGRPRKFIMEEGKDGLGISACDIYSFYAWEVTPVGVNSY